MSHSTEMNVNSYVAHCCVCGGGKKKEEGKREREEKFVKGEKKRKYFCLLKKGTKFPFSIDTSDCEKFRSAWCRAQRQR